MRLRATPLLRSAHGNARRRAARTGGSTASAYAFPARALHGDLLLRDRPVADPRPRPRDRRPPLLRRRGLDQHVHGRVPAAEPAPLAGRRRGALGGVRPRLQRAAREGKGDARLARRVHALLARAARPGRADRALHPARALAHAAVRLRGGAAGARRHALADPLPDRRPARPQRDRRRDPQQLRPLHRSGARAGRVEPRDHLRRRDRRAARGQRVGRALRVRGRRARRDGRPVPAPAAVAPRPRRPAESGDRLARPGDQADLRADAPRDARARAHQLQPGHQHASSRPATSTRIWRRRAIEAAFRIYMLPQGIFSVAIATVLFPSMSRLAARGDVEGLRSTVSLGLRQVGFTLLPASAVGAVLAVPIVRLLYERGAFGPTRPTSSRTRSSRSRSASRSTGRC